LNSKRDNKLDNLDNPAEGIKEKFVKEKKSLAPAKKKRKRNVLHDWR
jgi:hypothetical protein